MATKGKIDPRERDMNVPKEQTVAIFRQKGGPLSVEKAPVQKPQKGEALVHVIYSGVCHTGASHCTIFCYLTAD